MNRREAIQSIGITTAGVISAGLSVAGSAQAAKQAVDPTVPPPPGSHPKHDMTHYNIPHQRQPVLMLLYPGVCALDVAAAQQILARMGNTDVHLAWKTKDVISSDTDIPLQATDTFAEIEDDPFILLIPGGSTGISDVITDDKVMDFIAKKASKATIISASGSGTLILGALGLLKGYKTSGHWMTRDFLKGCGAHPVEQRVVSDRNRVTSAGGTGAIDLALHLVSRLRNDKMVAALTLANEYDPAPLVRTGTPRLAPADVTQMEWAMNAGLRDDLREALAAAKKRRKS